MGAGKSAVGRSLARALHLDFADSDDEIEARTGVDIPFIFEKEGEGGFRKREIAAIDDLSRTEGIVLATGGGAVVSPENRSHLGGRGFVVYLYTTVEQQVSRTAKGRERPLLDQGSALPGNRGSRRRDGRAQGQVGSGRDHRSPRLVEINGLQGVA